MFIQINLLPEHLRLRKDKAISVSSQQILSYVFIGACILIAINIIIFTISFSLGLNVNRLNKRLTHFKPDIQKIQQLERKLKHSQEKALLMQDIVLGRIIWAPKLQITVDAMPHGVWLKSMSIKSKNFNIDGTCVSLKGEEMNIIGGFINALKENDKFFKDFDKLELRSVQRRLIGGIEVVDFNFAGGIK